jgi:hypothetical protein
MGSIDSTKVTTYCGDIANQVHKAFPYLDLHFLVHHQGEKIDKVARLLPHLTNHPAFEEAASILKFKTMAYDASGFLGLAESYESLSIGFKRKRKCLGFISINLSQYANEDEAYLDVHFYTAQLVEVLSALQTSPIPQKGVFLQPHKNEIATCNTNLKSDVYSILQSVRDGQYDSAQVLAHHRSIETLTPQSGHNPEHYPFPLALDVVNHAIDVQFTSKIMSRSTSPIISNYQLANHITSCFDSENISTWIQFAHNSQTLAWGGFSASQILGAAINTSTNPFIKAIGHLLAELTNLSPVDEEHLPQGYNPFLANEINNIRHNQLVDETFEMTLIHAVEAESHLPIVRVANNQNEGLLKGRISGWCANALHSAAKAYLGAKERGVPPIQAARLEFQSVKTRSNWDALLKLAQHSVGLRRNGEIITLNELSKWCEAFPDAKFILESINNTLCDPKYNAVLEPTPAMPAFSPKLAFTKEAAPRLSNQHYAPAAAYLPEPTPMGSVSSAVSIPQKKTKKSDE